MPSAVLEAALRAGSAPAAERRLASLADPPSPADVVRMHALELMTLLDLDYDGACALREAVAERTAPPTATALDLCRRAAPPPVRTPLAALDAAFGGGLQRGAVLEIAGPPGAGKTQFCLTMAVLAATPAQAAAAAAPDGGAAAAAARPPPRQHHGVLYVDSERKFVAARLCEIARHTAPGVYDPAACGATAAEANTAALLVRPPRPACRHQRRAPLTPPPLPSGQRARVPVGQLARQA